MRSRYARLTLLFLFALSLNACAHALRSARIADLQDNPGRYQHHTVSISGVVTSSFSVPLVPYKMYRVDDGTGDWYVGVATGTTLRVNPLTNVVRPGDGPDGEWPFPWAFCDDRVFVGEYATIQETFSPKALDMMTTWIRKHTGLD